MNHKLRKLLLLIFGMSLVIAVVFLIKMDDDSDSPVAFPGKKPLSVSQPIVVNDSSFIKIDSTVKENIVQEPVYQVDIDFNVEKYQLTGRTKVEVWNIGGLPTKEIKFQLFLNAFNEGQRPPILKSFLSKAYPNGEKHGGIKVSSVYVDGKALPFKTNNIVMAIQLNSSWKPGTKKVISLDWKADIPEIHHRVGKDGGNFWFGNTLPILAAYDNGWKTNQYELIGDPFNSDIANFIVNIKTPKEYQVLATGSETEQLDAGVRLTRIEATKVRDFTFAVFKNTQKASVVTDSNIQVNLYYNKSKEIVAEKAVKQAAAFLTYMEQQLIDYPYNELDIFGNEMFITGMEYPGMVYIDSDRLNDPKGVQTVLHEIAHQWFYNLVGNDQIKEPWLDEGFATFYTNRYLQSKGLLPKITSELLAKERKNNSLKIAGVKEYTAWIPYWKGVYQRGSYLLVDLQRMMGEDDFNEMVQAYVEKYAYQKVTTSKFQDAVQQHYSKDLSSFWSDWFNL